MPAVSYPQWRYGHRDGAGRTVWCAQAGKGASAWGVTRSARSATASTGVSSPAHHALLPASGSETEPMEPAISRKALALIAAVLTLPILGSTAIAETSEERQACIGDAFRVCWAAIPNRNEVFRCLMDNRPRLNPACRVVMDQYRRPHRITRHSRSTARVE
jgi:hypothetical protein